MNTYPQTQQGGFPQPQTQMGTIPQTQPQQGGFPQPQQQQAQQAFYTFATPINTAEVEMTGRGTLPDGEYVVMIDHQEVKTTKAGNGRYISMQLEVQTGDYKNRKIFANYNIENPNPVAVEIAMNELGMIAKCVGLPTLQNTADLMGKPFIVRTQVKNDRVEIVEYKPAGGVMQQAPIQQPSPVQSAPMAQPVAQQTQPAQQPAPQPQQPQPMAQQPAPPQPINQVDPADNIPF